MKFKKRIKQWRKNRSCGDPYQDYINSHKWKAFRDEILTTRGRKCEVCGKTEGEMHVHHLHYQNFRHEKPEDVQVICRGCHNLHHFGVQEPTKERKAAQNFARLLKWEDQKNRRDVKRMIEHAKRWK